MKVGSDPGHRMGVGFVHREAGSDRTETVVGILLGSGQKESGFGRTMAVVPEAGVEEVGYRFESAQGCRVAERIEDIVGWDTEVAEIGRRAQEKNMRFAESMPEVATEKASWHKVVAVEAAGLRSRMRRGMLGSQTFGFVLGLCSRAE